MFSYFAARDDSAALEGSVVPPADGESMTSDVDPTGDAFQFLVELVYGDSGQDQEFDELVVVVQDGETTAALVRLAAGLRDTVADLDENVLQDLAEPWSADDSFQGVDADPVDFLTDLQHLCRHARTESAGVYSSPE